MTKVSINHGTEGPHHDPYGYTEIVVEIRGITYEFHSGLGEWVKVCGIPTEGMDYEELVPFFKELTGYFPHEWEKFYYTLQQRKRSTCKHCGSRKIQELRGYPGETLFCCGDCKEILDCEFTNSGIV